MCEMKGVGCHWGEAEEGWGCADEGLTVLYPPSSSSSSSSQQQGVFPCRVPLTDPCPLSLSPGCSSKSFKLYSPKEPPNGNAFPPFHPGTMLDRDVG